MPDDGHLLSEFSRVLEDTKTTRQDAGKALLMIEARIGELLPPAYKSRPARPAGPTGRFAAGSRRLPEAIKPKQAQRARAIASHPTEVAEVIREAEENEDILTKTAVRKLAEPGISKTAGKNFVIIKDNYQ